MSTTEYDGTSYTVGTLVRFTEDEECFSEGEYGVVVQDDNDGTPKVQKLDGSEPEYACDEYFTAVLPALSVGQRVKIVKPVKLDGYEDGCAFASSQHIGKTGVIVSMSNYSHVRVKLDDYGVETSCMPRTAVQLLADGKATVAGHGKERTISTDSTPDFKVGDKIVGLDEASVYYSCTIAGTHWIVTKVLNRGVITVCHDDDYPDEVTRLGETYDVTAKYFKLTTTTNKENTMSNTIFDDPRKALREQPDADTIILRKASLENNDGTPSSYGKEAMMDDLWRERRAAYAEKLRTAIKADEAAEAGEVADEQ